jgi:uncharacterized protein YjeT (DUF2065 family)
MPVRDASASLSAYGAAKLGRRAAEGETMLLAFTPDDLRRIGIPVAIVVGVLIGLWLMRRQPKGK